MHTITNLSVKAENYKSFKSVAGFDSIRPINVIIGKNNSGKSALVDLVQYLISPFALDEKGTQQKSDTGIAIAKPNVWVRYRVHASWVDRLFPEANPQMNGLRQRIMSQCAGADVEGTVQLNHELAAIRIHGTEEPPPKNREMLLAIRESLQNPLRFYSFSRLTAERDIVDESPAVGPEDIPPITSGGQMATTIIERHLHQNGKRRDLIDEHLLRAINQVLEPDCSFSRILVTQMPGGHWRVVLEDRKGRAIPLTDMGSGVKTVILSLLHILVMPSIRKQNDLSRWVFAFEELENNLHPAILRRLLSYLFAFCTASKCTLFLTTHSTVVIDMVSMRQDAQISHVTRDDNATAVRSVACRGTQMNALSDLGVRASDILLTNVVIWVEGPSDRYFLRRWLELYTDGQIKEFTHYQVVFLGGSLSAHYCLGEGDPSKESVDKLLDVLKVNHRAIVVLDSDRKSSTDELKPHVKRIVEESEKSGSYVWVTEGREIENYVPPQAMSAVFGADIPACIDPLASVFEHATAHGGHKSWFDNKGPYALRLCEATERDMLGQLDLQERLEQVAKRIAEWNGISLAGS